VTSKYEFFILPLPDRIGRDDNQQLSFPIGLYDNLPRPTTVPRLDHPLSLDDIWTIAGRSLEPPPKIEFGEAPVVQQRDEIISVDLAVAKECCHELRTNCFRPSAWRRK
jgi:hypothetical protein